IGLPLHAILDAQPVLRYLVLVQYYSNLFLNTRTSLLFSLCHPEYFPVIVFSLTPICIAAAPPAYCFTSTYEKPASSNICFNSCLPGKSFADSCSHAYSS